MASEQDRPQLIRTADYASARIEYRVIMPLLRNSILAGLNSHATKTGGRALDVGCGEQPFRKVLENKGYSYTSFDVAQNVAHNVDELGTIDSALPSSLTNRGLFDFILCTEVMEHVADWNKAFDNFNKLLAPGGRVLITCPHLWPLHEVPYDFWRPTPYALKYFADRFGFRVMEQANSGDGFAVMATVLAITSMEGRGPKPWRWFVHAAYALWKRVAVLLLQSRVVGRLTRVNTGLYLSNFLVMEKPAL